MYDEIERILQEEGTQKFGIGQSLFYQMPFFCEPIFYISDWCWEMIDNYHLIKNYNVPLSTNLDSTDVFTYDCVNVIADEINKINSASGGDSGLAKEALESLIVILQDSLERL